MNTKQTAGQRRQFTQLEHDMREYARAKVYNVMRDVVQSYQIAGISKRHAGACLGSLFMRLAAAFAVEPEANELSKEEFMRYCSESYDGALETKKDFS